MNNAPRFRAWHKKLKTMYDVSKWERRPCDDAGNVMLCLMPCNKFTFEGFLENIPSECVELMQWTGRLDCNGKEIYGADVISFNNEYISAMQQVGFTRFQESAYAIINNDDSVIMPLFAARNVKVLGNLFENPELTEVVVAK